MTKATATKHRKTTTRAKAARANAGLSKAQAIRDAAEKLGRKVRPKDIISALAAEGMTVSSPQVSATLKAAGYRRSRRAGRGMAARTTARSAASGRSIEVSLDKLGSVEAAKKAIEVLTKLA
jgi:hypothetical protein